MRILDTAEKQKYKYLLSNNLFVFGNLVNDNPNEINLESFKHNGKSVIFAYTSGEMLDSHKFEEDSPDLLMINGRELFAAFKEYDFVINRYADYPTEILKEEIDMILNI